MFVYNGGLRDGRQPAGADWGRSIAIALQSLPRISSFLNVSQSIARNTEHRRDIEELGPPS